MTELSHEAVWAAIDALAERCALSVSGLARRSGLDPTTFNRSKRFTGEGRPRWPSTESIAKALRATDTPLEVFMSLVGGSARTPPTVRPAARSAAPVDLSYRQARSVPMLGFAQAGGGGFFDDAGFPAGEGWEEIPLPTSEREGVYALRLSGDSMLPVYRNGDVILVDPSASVRPGDRVVVRTRTGEVMAKVLARQGTDGLQLRSVNPEHPDRMVASGEVEWIARIVWASQ